MCILLKSAAPSMRSVLSRDRFLKLTVTSEVEHLRLKNKLVQLGMEFKCFNLKQDRPIKPPASNRSNFADIAAGRATSLTPPTEAPLNKSAMEFFKLLLAYVDDQSVDFDILLDAVRAALPALNTTNDHHEKASHQPALSSGRFLECRWHPPPIRRGKGTPFEDLKKLQKIHNNVIFAGDFNATHTSWNNSKNNQRGVQLNKFLNENNHRIIAPTSATRIDPRYNAQNIIDFATFKNIPYPATAAVFQELSSDHLPCLLEINLNVKPQTIPNLFITNWDDYNFNLQRTNLKLTTINNEEDADNAIENFTKDLYAALNNSSKPKYLNIKGRLPKEIKLMIKNKNYLRRLYQRSRDPTIKEAYKKLENKIKTKIYIYKNSVWEKHTDSLTENQTAFWKEVKKLRKSPQIIPPLELDANNMALSPAEKAEKIADCWKLQFELNPNTSHSFTNNLIASETEKYFNCPHTNYIQNVTATEVIKFIKSLNPKKASGIDNINANMIRFLPNKYLWRPGFDSRHGKMRFHGVMVSTLDFESSDPSSNLGGTLLF
ncbi:RNA-directed DNA polymerase from mobile element jockey [Caerostris extrusa]|uniref:RNA-directed DNA polymerase from mobile element jockey n=1 Tax=Caerostris extrusa TaxID=172846 RepID=A0AAV4NUM9_CAEEX|nr:RNA-directed DNA polymerase from mobile element jockey [Caerostris extrusa]